MTSSSDSSDKAKGNVEDLKGRAKEALGALAGDDKLKREGTAQQDKAESQRELSRKEAELDEARVQAAVDEDRERSEQ